MDTEQLKRIPLFSRAGDEELAMVAAFAESKEIAAGTEIIKEGGFSNELFAIEKGEAEVSRDGRKIAKLMDGDIFGEAGLLDDAQRNATVTAKSRVRLIRLGHFEVKRLKRDAPRVYAEIERLVEERSG
jgi:cAMP-dependent protein kinase regulator